MNDLKFLTIPMMKAHLRLDDDADETMLTMYAASAEQAALSYMGRSIESLYEDYGGIPAPIISACLCRVATAWKHREDITDRNLYLLPYAWEAQLLPYVSPDAL